MQPTTSSVAGSITSRVTASYAGRHPPSINSPYESYMFCIRWAFCDFLALSTPLLRSVDDDKATPLLRTKGRHSIVLRHPFRHADHRPSKPPRARAKVQHARKPCPVQP